MVESSLISLASDKDKSHSETKYIVDLYKSDVVTINVLCKSYQGNNANSDFFFYLKDANHQSSFLVPLTVVNFKERVLS